jgi:hypothetical protein
MVPELPHGLAVEGFEPIADLAADPCEETRLEREGVITRLGVAAGWLTSASIDPDRSTLRAVDHLDAARDNLLFASYLLRGFRFPEALRVSEQDLVGEIRDLAFQASLLADLLDGLVADGGAAQADGTD